MALKMSLTSAFVALLASGTSAAADPIVADAATEVVVQGGRKLRGYTVGGEECRTQACIDRYDERQARRAARRARRAARGFSESDDADTATVDPPSPPPSPPPVAEEEPEVAAPVAEEESSDPVAAPVEPPAGGDDECGDEIEREMLRMTNEVRKAALGADYYPYKCSASGMAAVKDGSIYQCEQNNMSHDGYEGRCQDANFTPGSCRENVAMNWNSDPDYTDMDAAKKAVDGWENSEGHYQNMIATGTEYSAQSYYKCPDGKYYFTQMMGNYA